MMESIEKLREWSHRYDNGWIQEDGSIVLTTDTHGVYYGKNYGESIRSMIDEIEREIAERYMELPDAGDGKSIHVGDHMVRDGEPFTVCAIAPSRVHYWVWDKNGKCSTVDCDPMYCSHYKPRTLEDVLTDFAEAIEERGTEWVDVSQTANAIRELMKVVGE